METARQSSASVSILKAVGLWLAWTLVTTVGIAGGWMLSLWVELFGPASEEAILLWLLVGPLISWPVIGLCQLTMLGSRIKSKAGWVLLSGLAWIIAFVILLLALNALLGAERRFSMHPALLGTIAGLLIGAVFGSLQWLILRRSVASAGWWILASVIGWVLCLLLFEYLVRLPLPIEDQSKMALLLIAGASMVGMVTGLGYLWLFHPPAHRVSIMAPLAAVPLVLALGLALPLAGSYSQQGKILRSTYGLANILDISFSADGSMLAAVTNTATANSEYRGLVVWDVDSGKELYSLEADGDYVAFLSDGKRVVTAGHLQGPVVIWDLATGEQLYKIPAQANDIAVSPDGKMLAIGTGSYNGGEFILWDLEAGQALQRSQGALEIYRLAFSPNSKFVAMGMGRLTQRYVRVWDIEHKMPRLIIPNLPSISSLAFSPDNARLIFGAGKVLHTWSIDREKKIGGLPVGDQIGNIALSPDGKLVALAYGQLQRDPSIFLYNFPNGQLVDTLKGHIQAVTSLAFSPDGRYLASGSWDGTVRLWEISSDD